MFRFWEHLRARLIASVIHRQPLDRSHLSSPRHSLALVLVALCASATFAQDIANWNGGTGVWSNAANWSCVIGGTAQTCVPNGAIAITITSGTATLDVNASVTSLVLDSAGSLVITNGFQLNATSPIYVGYSSGSAAALNINNGGKVNALEVIIAESIGSSGTVAVTGANTKLTSGSYFLVGYAGSGSANISAGGQVSDQYGFISGYVGSSGVVTIDGAGSRWDNSVDAVLCPFGPFNQSIPIPSTLTLTNGATGSSGSGGLIVGGLPGVANMTLDGAGTTWADTGGIYVGLNLNTQGTLNVQAGATLSTTSNLIVGNTPNTLTVSGGSKATSVNSQVYGLATVSDASSQWNTSGTLSLTGNNSGSLNVQNGGLVSAGAATSLATNLTIGAGSSMNITGTFTPQGGTILVAGNLNCGSMVASVGATIEGTGVISGSTTIGSGSGAALLAGLNASAPGVLSFTGPLTLQGGELELPLTLGVQGLVAVTGGITLSSPPSNLLLIQQAINYIPPLGTTLVIMTANNPVVGSFNYPSNVTFNNGTEAWSLRYNQGGNNVVLVAVPTAPTTLTLLSGNSQTGAVQSPLPNPLVVKVTDISGTPIPGAAISFTISQQPNGATGTALSVTSAITGADGTASTQLTLGSILGQYQVTAVCTSLCTPGNNVVIFTEGIASAAQIMVTPSAIDFGSVNPNQSRTRRFVIQNTGPLGSLLVGSVSPPSSPFSMAQGSGTLSLPSGASTNVDVTFQPSTMGSFSDGIVITSNDPNTPSVTVSLSGSEEPLTTVTVWIDAFIPWSNFGPMSLLLPPLVLPGVSAPLKFVGLGGDGRSFSDQTSASYRVQWLETFDAATLTPVISRNVGTSHLVAWPSDLVLNAVTPSNNGVIVGDPVQVGSLVYVHFSGGASDGYLYWLDSIGIHLVKVNVDATFRIDLTNRTCQLVGTYGGFPAFEAYIQANSDTPVELLNADVGPAYFGPVPEWPYYLGGILFPNANTITGTSIPF